MDPGAVPGRAHAASGVGEADGRDSEKLMEETRLELGELQSQLLPPTSTLTANLLPLACLATVSGVPMTFQVQNISCVSG